jgi:uncharacterized metal-binding protein YceD (DUF177 family)
MNVLKKYTLPFVGLKDGKHEFTFEIDTTFFAHFEFTDFKKADLKGLLVLDKKPAFLELHFEVQGQVELSCDVSTEWFDHPIATQFDLIVKFGTPSDNDPDEILVIPEGSYQINVAHHFYEIIVLSLPLKRVHPGIEEGTLKNEILEKLKALEPKEEKLNGQEDPRWNKLKDLL